MGVFQFRKRLTEVDEENTLHIEFQRYRSLTLSKLSVAIHTLHLMAFSSCRRQYIHTFIYMQTHACVYTYMQTYICMYTYTCVCVCVCVCVCMCVCVVCVCVHIRVY